MTEVADKISCREMQDDARKEKITLPKIKQR